MERFVKGDVIILPFPFSDLSGSKRRPALVLADLDGDDIILCQITSQHTRDSYSVPLSHLDFITGSLPINSYIKVTRIFTADKNIIIRKTGAVKPEITNDVVQKIIALIK